MGADRPGDFGSKLREARERKGVTLRQIANRTKISLAALEALERNDISRLPGGIFSRAFVRSYATEVGLDPETTIQDFIEQFPHESITAGHSMSEPIEDFEEVESDRRMARTVVSIAGASVLVAAGVLYFTVVNRRAPAPSTAPVATAPPASTAAAEPPPVDSAAPAATTGPGAAAVSPARERTSAAAPSSSPTPSASAAAPATAAAEAPSDRLTIGLLARRPVWVSATVDGERVISRLLQTGERQTIEIKREMVITAGDAAALAMTLNGAEARALGKPAEVVTARINLTNFKEYLQAR